jgi:hypothetical protein
VLGTSCFIDARPCFFQCNPSDHASAIFLFSLRPLTFVFTYRILELVPLTPTYLNSNGLLNGDVPIAAITHQSDRFPLVLTSCIAS